MLSEQCGEINSMHSDIFAELDIYGQIEDNQEEWLKKLQTLAPGYIKYKGMVPFSQSTKVLKEYDALLFPTYYEGEGFAGTIMMLSQQVFQLLQVIGNIIRK